MEPFTIDKQDLKKVVNLEIGEEVCMHIANGASLRSIHVKYPHLPHPSTFIMWTYKDKELETMYRTAQEVRAHTLLHEIIDIVDADPERDDNGLISNAFVNWTKLRVDKRQYTLEKMHPARYGPKQQIEHSGEIKGHEPMVIVMHADAPKQIESAENNSMQIIEHQEDAT